MKLIIVTFFIFLAKIVYPQNQESQVQQIKQEFAKINALKLDTKSFPYKNRCGVIKASITIYFKNGEIRKITDVGIGDDDKAAAKWSYQYYYKNGNLIFSYETITSFDNEKEKNITNNNREYFLDNRLIKKIEDNKINYPENSFINNQDNRYKLKLIKKSSDIDLIYECLN